MVLLLGGLHNDIRRYNYFVCIYISANDDENNTL